MSTLTCVQARELAPELALGVLSGPQRADVVLHVNDCARCQALVQELAEVADAMLLVVPELEPPLGFERRTVARLSAPRRRQRRRFVAAIAAAVAAAAIVSITIVRVVEGTGGTNGGASVAAGTPVAVDMIGGEGSAKAGRAYVTDGRAVAVSVEYAIPSGPYRVHATTGEGRTFDLGSIAVDSTGHGSFTGRSPQTLGAGSTLSLVDSAGTAWCQGHIT